MESFTNIVHQLGDKAYKEARRQITVRYGYYTLVVTFILLLLIPYWNPVQRAFSTGIYNRIRRRVRAALRLSNRRIPIDLSILKLIAFLSLVLCALTFLQTNNDLGFVAARLGRVAVYCLPTLLFLTLRPSPLPQTFYLKLIPIHKWLSRLIVLMALVHSIMYAVYFILTDTLYKIYKLKNLTGVAAMLAFFLIFITSLPWIRRSFYSFFFFNHYFYTWVVVITLYFHSRPSIPYLTLTNIAILLFQIFQKFRMSSITSISVHKLSANIAVVEIPNWAIKVKSSMPGCHIRMIDFPQDNYLKCLYNGLLIPEQHPYTLATLPVDDTQRLIVRRGDFLLDDTRKYLVTGSYLPFLQFLHQVKNANPRSLAARSNVKKCLIVVGGSAISFALPILRVLNYNGAMVKIIWVIRDHEDLKVLDYFKNVLVSDDCIDIFITGKYSQSEKVHFKEVVGELHRRKAEEELTEERRMMGFNVETGRSIPRRNSDDPLGIGFDRAIYRKKSRVSLRNHNLSHSYSYGDDDKFENVDIELDGIPNSSNLDDKSPLLFKSGAPEGGYLATDGSDGSDSSDHSDCPRKTPNMGYYPSGTILDNLDPSKYTSSSSELYDDLADYWVIKGLACRIDFGRPTLGLYYYNWCVGSSCVGPMVNLRSGEPVCYSQFASDGSSSVCFNVTESEDDLFKNTDFIKNRKARFRERGGRPDDKIWVVGAGPRGLVNKVRMWADDCGFRFHEERFSI
ncbi:DEKNAAC104859 [Brettanomyces naardenensis]|uniref:DEKNAAC104859 n=1 Tax=Brettanomyces naardenensis TaxID=13370 RepID=A0A448YSH2_BRENA|nr:DEKNAAC104859 [Brettanomyces naardenensis]